MPEPYPELKATNRRDETMGDCSASRGQETSELRRLGCVEEICQHRPKLALVIDSTHFPCAALPQWTAEISVDGQNSVFAAVTRGHKVVEVL